MVRSSPPVAHRGAILARYCLAAGLVRLGDEMVPVTLVLLALERTSRPALAGALVAAYTLPAIVSGPLLGAWLDRAAHTRAALAGNALVLAVAALALQAEVGRAPALAAIGLAAMAGIALPLTSAGFTSMVPRLVGDDALPRANRVDAVTFNVAAIGGPALAGSVTAAKGAGVAMVTVTVVALLGVVATVLLPLGRAPLRGAAAVSHPSLLGAARRGIARVVRVPALRGATIASALAYGAVGVLGVALPLLARARGGREAAAGWCWAALELGAMVGTLTLGRRLARVPPERVVFAGTATFGLVLAAVPLAPSLAGALALLVAAGFVEGPVLPSLFAVRQRDATPGLLSQVSMTAVSLKVAAFAMGAAAGGWLVPRVGPGRALWVVAAGQLVAATTGALLARDLSRRGAPRAGVGDPC